MQTERAKNYFPKKIQEKSIIIPNPVKVPVYAEKAKQNRIVSVGRLTEQKNHALLIDSFKSIAKEFPDTILDIYGEGPKRAELQEKIDNFGLSARIRLRGNILDVHEQIKDAGVFVLPSNYEGTSNALLEAMMMGLPCISTDCAGSDEVIENKKSGIIVPVGDQDALTRALRTLLSDRVMADNMAHAAHERVSKNYSADYVSQQWMKVAKGEI